MAVPSGIGRATLVFLLVAACSGPGSRVTLPPDDDDDAGLGGRGGGGQGGAGGAGAVGGQGASGGSGAVGGGAAPDAPVEDAPGVDLPPPDLAPDLPPPPSCIANAIYCDGDNVRSCDAMGYPGPVLEMCAPAGMACSAARCTTPACAAAEAKSTFVGCVFYTFDVDNSTHDDGKKNLVLLGNPGTVPAVVSIQTRVMGTWTQNIGATLIGGGVEAITLDDRHLEGPGIARAQAWRIVSDNPIVAYHVQSDDRDIDSETSGGTILLPKNVLGIGYMPMTWAQQSVAAYTASYGPLTPTPQVSVLGTADGTKVTFQVGPAGSIRAGGVVPARAAGMSFDAMLDEGDVMQIYGAAEGDDLTGSFIQSTKPVAVFSGNIGTSYGKAPGVGIQSADMTHEQMIPMHAWGNLYVAARLNSQSACGSDNSTWRILAALDDTTVSFEAPGTTSGVPAAPIKLDHGRFLDLSVGGMGGALTGGDFFVSADKPILLGQFLPCEPALALSVSAEQLLTDFLFVAPPIFDHQIAIVRKAGVPVMLDGALVAGTLFGAAGGGFEVARLNVPKCDVAKCGHRITGMGVGVALRGQDTICGYAFSGGMAVRMLF